MTTVIAFNRSPVRALVVEQLSAEQWHVVCKGAAVPEGSWEDRWTGAEPFAMAAADALDKAECIGLPVFVEPYQQGLAPLSSVAPPARFSRRRRGRSTLDEIMSGRGAA